jgi:XRE family aerobic/anaerobic benzoate catabolism transcriptional regulator
VIFPVSSPSLAQSIRQKRLAELPESDRILLADVGRRLRQARTAKSLTLAQLAGEVDVNPSYLGELERGRANVSVTTLAARSRALGCSLRDFLPQ